MIDEFEYPFPYLTARFIHIWPERRGIAYYPPPYYYPPYYYPGFYPYGYPPYGYGPPIILPPPTPRPERRFEAPADKEPSPSQGPNGNSKRRFENKTSE